MKKSLPLVLLAAVLLLSACGPRNNGETFGSASSPPPQPPASSGSMETGVWELVCDRYMPVTYDVCKAISFPMFDGMTEESFKASALELGYNFEANLTFYWAIGGELSPKGRYLAYRSNKDCLEPVRSDVFSVFLLDLFSGTEQVLLSGSDGGYYNVRSWLDEETLLCSKTDYAAAEQNENYFLCGVDGSVKPLGELFHTPLGALGLQGRLVVEAVEQELRLFRIETDGSITELAQATVEGYPINGCGISPDGGYVGFVMWKDPMASERTVALWNTKTGQVLELENPTMSQGKDAAAIYIHWLEDGFGVDFSVSDAPDSNGHFELWLYPMESERV